MVETIADGAAGAIHNMFAVDHNCVHYITDVLEALVALCYTHTVCVSCSNGAQSLSHDNYVVAQSPSTCGGVQSELFFYECKKQSVP